jgi:SAM-dependent methyltransferase
MRNRDYVLGTDDGEIERLALQHRVWRAKALEAWRRGGIGTGMTVLDVGAGPGFAATDLARIVGPQGRVIAVERSGHFLAALRARAARLNLANIEAREQDLCETPIAGPADAAWCRWVLSFAADAGLVSLPTKPIFWTCACLVTASTWSTILVARGRVGLQVKLRNRVHLLRRIEIPEPPLERKTKLLHRRRASPFHSTWSCALIDT